MKRTMRVVLLGSLAVGALAFSAKAATTPSLTSTTTSTLSSLSSLKTHPMYLPSIRNQWAGAGSNHTALQPPAPPCPESGLLPAPFSNCGLPEFPAVGQPYVGNMAYWGGHVQTTPVVYLVYWGWGQSGAFNTCGGSKTFNVNTTGGSQSVTLACDPDGAGTRMADFVSQIGGTNWEGVTTQYYGTAGAHITNPGEVLGGIWVDDANPNPLTPPISANAGYTAMAQEAENAAAYFRVSGSGLDNANFVIVQPQKLSDPAAQSVGYCAFHDYTEPVLENHIYDGITPGISYTNMPYVLDQGTGCGENLVNSGPAGTLDAFTIALGHEILETVTDPGAEDILPDGTVMGGWFDPFDANENGDKCAYVGASLLGGIVGPNEINEPGAADNITGSGGGSFPVQSTWSNSSLGGVGYCAGVNDLPAPLS